MSNNNISQDFELLDECPICSSKENTALCHLTDRLYSDKEEPKFTFSKCSSCKAIYLSKRVPEKLLGNYYPETYSPYEAPKTPKKTSWLRYLSSRFEKITSKPFNKMANKKRLDTIKNLYEASPGKLLDYGCGGPAFLNYAQKHGWDTTGADFTEYPVNVLLDTGHKAVLIDDNIDRNIDDNSYDVIRMNHVFEHVYSPEQTNSLVLSKLKLGGKFHLAMPNPQGISTRLLKQYSLALESPRHIILYPPELIKKLLEEAGFVNVQVMGEYLSKDFCRSIAIWKHTLLKKPLPMTHILHAHEKSFADVIYSPIIPISQLLNAPDRYHIIAEKA